MPVPFHDVRLDLREPFGMTVSTTRRVSVVTLASGHEARNARTAFALRRFLIPLGPRPMPEASAIAAFFEARNGPLHGFRFTDPSMNATGPDNGAPGSQDLIVGVGDGVRTAFALVLDTGRPVTRPKLGSVMVAVNGVALALTGFSLVAGGIIELAIAPPSGAMVTAGCRFDLPVRFENDTLSVTRNGPATATVDDLVLREVIE